MTADSGVPARRSRVAVEAPAPIPHDPYPYRAPTAPAVPAHTTLDNAGELLRALAAPVRIAIVLQLRNRPAVCTSWSTRWASHSPWSASICAF